LKIIVGENDPDDIKFTIMDPNTRMLIHINIEDFDNDMAVFQMLRGGNIADMALRRAELAKFEVLPEMIDT